MKAFIKFVHYNTLSCEPIVRKTISGDLLLICQCGGATEPSIENRVYVFRSKDSGRTWQNEGLIMPDDGRAVYQTEVFVYKSGTIDVFMTTHNGRFLFCDTFILRSLDNGHTFFRVELPFNGFKQGLTFFRGILILESGKMLLPYHTYPIEDAESHTLAGENKALWDGSLTKVETGVMISADGGMTYTKGGSFFVPFQDKEQRWKAPIVWTEPTLIQLSDKTVRMLFRIDNSGSLFCCDSLDEGESFTPFLQTNIPNPNNKPKLLRLDKKRIALINTPSSNCGRLQYRHPLGVWISGDDMKTWSVKHNISDLPGVYCYPDGFVSDDGNSLIFAFENRHDIFFVDVDVSDKPELIR